MGKCIFWYRPTRVVPDQRPLNGRCCTKRQTGKPIQAVKVKCAKNLVEKLLATKLVINNKTCVIERKRSVIVIRRYNCQRFGHIARNCLNQARCQFCSSCHREINESCLREVYCIDCSGHHPASSSQCPSYMQRYANLAKQHTVCRQCFDAVGWAAGRASGL